MSEKGQGIVEYALLLVLIAIVTIAALMILEPVRPQITELFVSVSNWNWTAIIEASAAIIVFGAVVYQFTPAARRNRILRQLEKKDN